MIYEIDRYAYEYVYNTINYSVGVDKVGGGRVGKAYEQGNWVVTVVINGEAVFDNEVIYQPLPKTHEEMASLAISWAYDEVRDC